MASKRFQLTWRNTLLLFCSLGALAAFFAFAGAASAMRDVAAATPSVVSDQADYNPGATVTLTGADWGGGEIVHVTVNDDVGQTWAYNTDITADDAGNFTLQFQLPNTFVANYRVTATGSSGAATQTTFTDSQPQTPTVGSPTSVTVVAGGTANFGTVTVTMNGNNDQLHGHAGYGRPALRSNRGLREQSGHDEYDIHFVLQCRHHGGDRSGNVRSHGNGFA